MAGFIAAEFADQTGAQQVQITDGIENLVLHEFVLVTQAVFIEHTGFVHHDGVLNTAAERQIVRAEELDVAHEPEGPCTADFLDEGSAREVHTGSLGATLENRVIEIDLEAHLEAVERQEGRALVALLDRHFTLDANELLVGVLLLQAGGLNQEYERPSAAVHDRHFRRGEFDVGVVDPQAGHCRKQMLHSVDLDVTVDQRRGHGGFANILGPRGNLHRRIEVGATEHDPGVHRCRFQGEINLLSRMQADAGGANDVLQGALSDHGLLLRCSTSCE